MKSDYHIIIKPLITEKSTILKEDKQHYCFEVARSANKHQVKKAIENIFQVKVQSIRVANVRGKVRRLGRNIGKRPNWKKAYVKLKEGEKPIDFFKT
jgi:large subunit ribosomal protein L23